MITPSVQDTCAKRFFAQRRMLNCVKSIAVLGLLVTVSTVVAYLMSRDHCSGTMCDFKPKFYTGGNVTAGSIAGTAGVGLVGVGLMALVIILKRAICCVSRSANQYPGELIQQQLARAIHSLVNASLDRDVAEKIVDEDAAEKIVDEDAAKKIVRDFLGAADMSAVVHQLESLFREQREHVSSGCERQLYVSKAIDIIGLLFLPPLSTATFFAEKMKLKFRCDFPRALQL